MANIKINELQPAEFAELSDLELEAIVGGKGRIIPLPPIQLPPIKLPLLPPIKLPPIKLPPIRLPF